MSALVTHCAASIGESAVITPSSYQQHRQRCGVPDREMSPATSAEDTDRDHDRYWWCAYGRRPAPLCWDDEGAHQRQRQHRQADVPPVAPGPAPGSAADSRQSARSACCQFLATARQRDLEVGIQHDQAALGMRLGSPSNHVAQQQRQAAVQPQQNDEGVNASSHLAEVAGCGGANRDITKSAKRVWPSWRSE